MDATDEAKSRFNFMYQLLLPIEISGSEYIICNPRNHGFTSVIHSIHMNTLS